jgi:hypothetical protein
MLLVVGQVLDIEEYGGWIMIEVWRHSEIGPNT